MALIDARQHELWRAAITSALGPLSAYITPQSFGLSLVGLRGAEHADEDFKVEIQRRIDLGRACVVAEIVEGLSSELPHTYRHSVRYSEDRIDGVLVVPRLVRERAAGRTGRIPVLRAARFSETPEALLTSELLRVSARVASDWSAVSGAEGLYARRLAVRVRALEAQQPWAALRTRPRAALRSLASSVKSRAVAGWTPLGGGYDRLAELALGVVTGVTADTGPIMFLVSEDERYADRLFELICLGWLLSSLKKMDPAGEVNVSALRGTSTPIFKGARNGVEVRLHYQAGYFSRVARYVWRKTGSKLRAIPDYSLELDGSGWSRSVLLDAKNRGLTSRSEIIYKLLGYQENLGLSPYTAIGIAPEYGAHADLSGVVYAERSAFVIRIPLNRGKRIFERLVPFLIDGMTRARGRATGRPNSSEEARVGAPT